MDGKKKIKVPAIPTEKAKTENDVGVIVVIATGVVDVKKSAITRKFRRQFQH